MLGDRELRMPARVEPAMRFVAEQVPGGDSFGAADVPGLDDGGRVVLVRRLVREGLLELADRE